MTTEIKPMMSVSEAINWVHTWRRRHFAKRLNVKDKALITLTHEVEQLHRLLVELSADARLILGRR